MISDLRSGDRLVTAGKPDNYFEILDGRIHAGTLQIFDAERRESRFIEEATIRSGLSKGEIVLHRKGMARVGVVSQHDDPAFQAKVRFIQNTLRRIDSIQRKCSLSFSAAIPVARTSYMEENTGDVLAAAFPSRATLFRAHKNQLLGLTVLKGDKNKGNSTPRYSQDLVEFIESTINDEYLVTESRWTLGYLTEYINREARRRCLHAAKREISRKFVAARIHNLSVDADYDRMDPLQRVAGKSYAKRRIRAPFAFARIEQDAVHLPFVVQTPHGISRTIYLVHAIDVCTGYPVGWRIVIGAPREMDSISCIEMYLTPAKIARFEEFDITHAINLYGTPAQIIFDNGPECKGGRIIRLELIEIDIKHCKAKEAQGKPFIERLNRALKEALQTLPGCTRFDGKDGKRDPEALGDQLMTVDALEKWIVRWLYDDWANFPLDRLRWENLLDSSVKGKTPLERLAYLTQEMGHPITMPPPRQKWMAAVYEHKQCVLSAKSGITVMHGFRYKGEAMSYLLSKYGDHAPLHVLYDPDDFRQAYVYEDDDLPLVTLTHEHVRPDTPAWTFDEAKERFKADMENWDIPAPRAKFLHDLDDAAIGNNNPRKPKSRNKREENKETTQRAKNHAAVKRSTDNPLHSSAPFGFASATAPPLDAGCEVPDSTWYDDMPSMTIVNRNTGEQLL
ncbi:transposase [Duganella sp. BJB488]|uniref:transposase n=1 Tax=unclassified Duganella TaxID=2636909 RepID=UPI000E3550F3|nr:MULTISPECIES: transposase [unclassified Duganella]NVD74577.1 transposase [Duganella sp. BJB1802]RFP09108.1 transposase [Duganella sp. BJB489]RFP12538.1 transposase [Duganella sp. BJB488]RFP29106.1 transposase [Duganella sp. BJB480]